MADANPESILESVKKVLGFEPSYTAFDLDIVMHVNTALGFLQQLKVGPVDGYVITGNTEKWSDFISVSTSLPFLQAIKTYVYLTVRLIFDPPSTSFAIASAQELRKEHEFRILMSAEAIDPPSDPFEPVA